MAGLEFQLDYNGVGKILKSPGMRDVVMEAAIDIAGNLSIGTGGSVILDRYTTDRAAVAITIIDRDASGLENKYGAISAAVEAAGLDFSGSL